MQGYNPHQILPISIPTKRTLNVDLHSAGSTCFYLSIMLRGNSESLHHQDEIYSAYSTLIDISGCNQLCRTTRHIKRGKQGWETLFFRSLSSETTQEANGARIIMT